MRLRRSGRVILSTTLVLGIFSGLVIWHDSPARLNEAESQKINSIFQKHPHLKLFLDQTVLSGISTAFYSVGLKDEGVSWPIDGTRACYIDPLLARLEFARINADFPEEVEVIRYRSKADFSLLLLNHSQSGEAYLSSLTLNSHTLIPERPFALSLKSIISMVVGLLGLFLVRWVK